MRVLSGIDLPLDTVCGSLLLADDMYQELRRSGHEVCFYGLRAAGSPLVAGARALEVDKGGADDPAYIQELAAKIAASQLYGGVDAVHLHHLGYGMAKALLSLEIPAPHIAFAHGTDVYDALNDPAAAALATNIADRAQVVVFPSVSLYREAVEAGIGIDPGKVRVIPWGLPEDCFVSAPPAAAPRALRILVASRLTANKDVSTVLRALARLPEHRLTVHGEGRELEGLIAEADRLGVAGRVAFRPMMDRRRLWRIMREHDCMVFPTRRIEAFGLAGLEAQAAGVPLIVSSLPVFGEVFGGSAAVFAAEDERALADQLAAVAADDRLRSALRAAGVANAGRYRISLQAAAVERLHEG